MTNALEEVQLPLLALEACTKNDRFGYMLRVKRTARLLILGNSVNNHCRIHRRFIARVLTS